MLNTQESSQKYNQLVSILREMFQMDNADLDFGIYRIMNTKHEQIEQFLYVELRQIVEKTFEQYKTDELQHLEKRLAEERTKARQVVDEDQVDNTKKVRPILERIEQLRKQPTAELLGDDLYGHLISFFGRYYDTGDFISQRRYKKDVYAIPYEGEEVKLYWANHDQYYIKTTQYFTNYTFKIAGGKTVIFQVREASTERDNNKAQNGKQRVFMLDEKESYRVDGDTLYIYFNYVLVEKKSKTTNGEENQESSDSSPAQNGNGNGQKAINQHIVELITKSLDQDDLKPFRGLASPVDEKSVRTLLEKNLTQYTARNEFDYFIHKNLKKFLEQELDFYIKTDIIHVDDFDTENEVGIEATLALVKVFKRIAKKLIAFLSQIENFQKKMWLKKKIVVSSEYCMTLHHVDKRHYPAILANKAQLAEWVKLGFINNTPQVTEDFLNTHQSLVLDTAFFPDLRDELIADIDNLDDKVGGVLINSENFQALHLLQERYREQVKCVYIDPPYNKGDDGFLYKDNYKHSSWIAMLNQSLLMGYGILDKDGVNFISIDDDEVHLLHLCTNDVFGTDNFIGRFIWRKKFGGGQTDDYFVKEHEYVLVYRKSPMFIWNNEEIPLEAGHFKLVDEETGLKYNLIKLEKWGSGAKRSDRPTMYFSIKDPSGKSYFPVAPDKSEGRWRVGKKTMEYLLSNDLVFWKEEDGKYIPYEIDYYDENGSDTKVLKMRSIFYFDVATTTDGTNAVTNAFGVKDLFNTAPKPPQLIADLAGLQTSDNDIILDYFAGSGTTGHAVINLNRDDDGERKYILVEMGTYFDTVLKPRIQKVIYSANWKGGKPQDTDSGISHIFKYMRLESYEDTMNNLVVNPVQATLFDGDKNPIAKLRETYLLSYMLDLETRDSRSLLGYGALNNPFHVEMSIIGNDNQQTPQIVNLVETFNYLLGLHVDKMLTEANGMKIVKGKLPRSQETVLVVWRVVGTHSDEELNAMLEKHDATVFDKVYVNGENTAHLSQLRLIEEIFAERMFPSEES